MTDKAEDMARGIADNCIHSDEIEDMEYEYVNRDELAKAIAAALRAYGEQRTIGLVDLSVVKAAIKKADAEGYRRGYQAALRHTKTRQRVQDVRCDGECSKECKTCWPTEAGE